MGSFVLLSVYLSFKLMLLFVFENKLLSCPWTSIWCPCSTVWKSSWLDNMRQSWWLTQRLLPLTRHWHVPFTADSAYTERYMALPQTNPVGYKVTALFIYLFIYLSIHPSIHPSLSLSLSLPTYLCFLIFIKLMQNRYFVHFELHDKPFLRRIGIPPKLVQN